MRSLLVLLSGLAAMAACKTHRGDLWHNCNLAAGTGAPAFAYAGDDAVVLMRDGKRFSVPYTKGSCLERGKDIDLVAVLADGWRVVVVGETTDDGFMDPHPQFATTVACVVDFQTRLAVPLGAQVPAELGLTDEIRHRAIRVGGRTGRIYTWTGFDDLRIFDPTRKEVAPLTDIDVPLSDGCDVAETEREAVIACTGYRSREGGGEDGFVRIIRMEVATWPPVAQVSELAAPSPPSRVALSPDATRVGYWANSLGGGGGYLRVTDLATPDLTIDLPHGEGDVSAVAFSGRTILVGSTVTERSRDRGVVRIFAGGPDAPPEVVQVPDRIHALYPAGGRVLVDQGCDARWITQP